jgi:hypothetical protein
VLNLIGAAGAFWPARLSWRPQLLKHASIFLGMGRSADSGKTQRPATNAVQNSIDASSLFWLALPP